MITAFKDFLKGLIIGIIAGGGIVYLAINMGYL